MGMRSCGREYSRRGEDCAWLGTARTEYYSCPRLAVWRDKFTDSFQVFALENGAAKLRVW